MKSVEQEYIEYCEDWWDRNPITGFYAEWRAVGGRTKRFGNGHWDDADWADMTNEYYFSTKHWSRNGSK